MSETLAVFDIDGTLVQGDCGVIFAGYCARRGLLGARELGFGLWWGGKSLLGRIDEVDVAEAKRIALLFQSRVGEKRAAGLMDKCFEEKILPRRRTAVLAELAQRRTTGHVALVTANLRDFALRWGAVVGVPSELCFGAEGLREAGVLTGDLTGPVPIGEERARLVARLMEQFNIDKLRTSAFGDSMFDVPMLRVVGEPNAVHPSRKLRQLAVREGWRVVE